MEINFQEDLMKFNSEHAKLFYLIYHFSKHKDLNPKQKTKLKSLIISEDEKIFGLLDEFEETQNEKKLLKELVNICRGRAYNDYQNETPKRKNKDDFSLSHNIKENLLKNSCESSSKIFGSKLSVAADRSFLNKTTVPFDSKIKTKFGKFADYKYEEFISAEKKNSNKFNPVNTYNKIQNFKIKAAKRRDDENLNIILINNTGLYQYSPLNRAYHSISRQTK